jgi:hypothetical protein
MLKRKLLHTRAAGFAPNLLNLQQSVNENHALKKNTDRNFFHRPSQPYRQSQPGSISSMARDSQIGETKPTLLSIYF